MLRVRKFSCACKIFLLAVIMLLFVLTLLLWTVEILLVFLEGILGFLRLLNLGILNSEFYAVLYILVVVSCELPKLILVQTVESFICDEVRKLICAVSFKTTAITRNPT